MPPEPASVSKRTSGRCKNFCTPPISFSRPMNGAGWRGRSSGLLPRVLRGVLLGVVPKTSKASMQVAAGANGSQPRKGLQFRWIPMSYTSTLRLVVCILIVT